MSKTDFNADIEALRAELRKKGHDLLLAARYGKGLLEENSQYQKDLESAKQECATLKEVGSTVNDIKNIAYSGNSIYSTCTLWCLIMCTIHTTYMYVIPKWK